MKVITHTWTLAHPEQVAQDVREVPDEQVPAYLARLERDGRAWGVSFASYDIGASPWRLLRWYDEATGRAGDRCEHPKPAV